MISAREAVGSRDDIWTSAEKGYDMKNDMLWSVYHILQHSFPESIPVFSEYRVTGSLVICVVLCRLLFIFFVHCIVCPSTIYSFWPPLCSSFCPLYCLSFYNLQFLTTPLVSSNLSLNLQNYFCISFVTCYHLKSIRKLENRLKSKRYLSITGAWRFINKIDVGYKKSPVPYIYCALHLFYW
jgi:hypothetical protein